MTTKKAVIGLVILSAALFLGWRFVRPMNIFSVTKNFERPISTAKVPEPLETLSAKECAGCHQEIYDEWSTTIHSKAWTDPYFRVDFKFDGSPQICLNCHTPLDRQQENLVLGFRDDEKWDPILAPNPDFDHDLQQEGVTCAACHVKEGAILGPSGVEGAPHPVKKMGNPNQVCLRCHVVEGERWDAFFKFPPCGTVAEIRATQKTAAGSTGEIMTDDVASLGCVECHMPLVERSIVEGGEVRAVRRHLWRGGHDPEMVKGGLQIDFDEDSVSLPGKRRYKLVLTNTGAAHYFPTGTPDRHLTVRLRLLDENGEVLEEQEHILKRTVMWRPFIVDLWDTRLKRGQSRTFSLEFPSDGKAASIEAVVRYFLVDEARRRRIGYDNTEPVSYEVFRRTISVKG